MIALTVAEVAELLDAPTTSLSALAGQVSGVVIDSRAVRPGSLFVALPGERADGHDFVVGALEQGAVASITSRQVEGARGPCLMVPDPAAALGRLARHVVDRATSGGLQVVAITGSQGKTSTKDLLAQVLEPVGATVAPVGNLNNELGVPLTACRVDEATRFLVVEMGARGIGHIGYLCRLTPPQVGVVLNVGQAHVGEFGSQQAIAAAKGELVEALPATGLAVLNADDPLVWGMRSRTAAPVLAFSATREPDADEAVWATDVEGDELGRCRFVLHARSHHPSQPEAQAEVELRLSGRHHVANAVAAAAAGLALGVPLERAAVALSQAQLRSGSRMEIHQRDDDVVVINDAYNANPDSARAAVETLAEIGRARRAKQPGARTWALLGDMLELGESALDEHTQLGRHVGRLGIDRLIAVGEFAAAIADGATSAGLAANSAVVLDDKTSAAVTIVPYLQAGDVVLVKASRGLALDTVAAEIWTASPRRRSSFDSSEDPA